jgi:hypothetical protein
MGPRYTSVEEYRWVDSDSNGEHPVADATAAITRLDQAGRYEKHWKRWGPYLSERQWVSRLTPQRWSLAPPTEPYNPALPGYRS